MHITSIELYPSKTANPYLFSFRDPTSTNPFQIKSISGLDADEIVARYYGSGVNESFYTLSITKRDIVVRIALNPNYENSESYSTLRDLMYRVISASRTGKISFLFKDGEHAIAGVSGFIKRFEASHFTKTPELQLTVECSDPMLKSIERFTIPTVQVDSETLLMTDDESTAPHGFISSFTFMYPKPSFTIGDENWSFEVAPSAFDGFYAGDRLYISSELDNRHVYFVRKGQTYHLADAIVTSSIWPILFPGDNAFVITEETEILDKEHYLTYWGV